MMQKPQAPSTKPSWTKLQEAAKRESLRRQLFPLFNENSQLRIKASTWAAEAFLTCLYDAAGSTRRKNHIWYACGPTGTGKSHLMRAVVSQLQCEGTSLILPGRWPQGKSLPKVFMGTFSILDDQKQAHPLEEAMQSDIVFVDDVGAETDQYKSGVPLRNFHALIDALERKYLILTSNILPQDAKTRWNERIESRIMGSNFFNFSGIGDWRKEGRNLAEFA